MAAVETRLYLWPFYIAMILGIFLLLGNYVIKNIAEDEAYNEKVLAIDLAFIHDGMASSSGEVLGTVTLDAERDVVLDRTGGGCSVLVGSGGGEEHKEEFYCGLGVLEIDSDIVNDNLITVVGFRRVGGEVYIGQNG